MTGDTGAAVQNQTTDPNAAGEATQNTAATEGKTESVEAPLTPEARTAAEAKLTPEQKAEYDKLADEKAKDEYLGKIAKPDAATLPESYEIKELPEGFTVDPEMQTEFDRVGKELGLTQEQADKLTPLGVKLMQKQVDAWNNQLATWRESCAKTNIGNNPMDIDPNTRQPRDFGGANFEQTKMLGNKAIHALGDDELKKDMVTYGFANIPSFVRMAARAGRLIREDDVIVGGKGGAAPTAAQVLWPNADQSK